MRGLNRSGNFSNGTPVTVPVSFGNQNPPTSGGTPVDLSTLEFGNRVTWGQDPAHFGNQIGSSAPTFTSVDPDNGPVAGGTRVQIGGGNFTADTQVTFGGQPATNVVVTDANVLHATTPAGFAGTVDIEILNESGVATAPDAFTYA